MSISTQDILDAVLLSEAAYLNSDGLRASSLNVAGFLAAAIVDRQARDPRLPALRGSVEQAFACEIERDPSPRGRGAAPWHA